GWMCISARWAMSSRKTFRRNDMTANWNFETRQIHAGQTPDAETGARALPIYQTTSYVFKDTDEAANRFALSDLGPLYTRITNPTQQVVEDRLASLEGGGGALLVASGQSAEFLALVNIAEAGGHIVASPSLYGRTPTLPAHAPPQLGIQLPCVANPDDPESWRSAIQDNTKLFCGESSPDPKGGILDIEAVAAVAHDF